MHHEEVGQEGLGEMTLRVQVFMKVGRWRWGLVRLWQQPVRNLCLKKPPQQTNLNHLSVRAGLNLLFGLASALAGLVSVQCEVPGTVKGGPVAVEPGLMRKALC